jgi:hypothetical protein
MMFPGVSGVCVRASATCVRVWAPCGCADGYYAHDPVDSQNLDKL